MLGKDNTNVKFSVIIPARNEEKFIGSCLSSILKAAGKIQDRVEIIVVLNRCTDSTEKIALEHGARIEKNDEKNLSKIRNSGVKKARGEIIITLDADSRMHEFMLVDVAKALESGKYIGGAVFIRLERYSIPIFLSVLMVMPYFLLRGISGGSFWCYKNDFNKIQGFNENLLSFEDLDFAKRLKRFGKESKRKFKILYRAHITTSCRKFDMLGEWYMLKNFWQFWTLLKGQNKKLSNYIWYDAKR